ncbi:MAG TPA: hypothetical protein VMG12_18995 [Polyangiaceae bacterium]|nr:hypothetical protein [Polyangiaceae bacterium]
MQDSKKDTTKEAPRSSQLSKGRERFLAHVIEHGFEVGRRSPEDFVRHFPPTIIMEGLKDNAKLRADILVQATGVKEKVAIKKSWESCADDLQIALDENETNATAVMKIFQLDDRVRYLDHKALWSYVTEGEFWKISPSRQKEYAAAKSHMAFMLQRALEDKLVSHQDIVEGITVEELASRLPKSELGKIIKGALECGKRNAPFTETDLLGSMPPDVLVNYMPLFQVWDAIIDPKIAIEHGYTNKKKADKVEKPEAGTDFGTMPPSPATASNPLASPAGLPPLDEPPVTASEDDLNAFLPPTSRGDEKSLLGKDDKDGKQKSRPKTPPPPLPAAAAGKAVEDPSTWSQEFDEDTEFVDAADLLDEEPTINSKSGIGKENII